MGTQPWALSHSKDHLPHVSLGSVSAVNFSNLGSLQSLRACGMYKDPVHKEYHLLIPQ